jgi:hypothetical protein
MDLANDNFKAMKFFRELERTEAFGEIIAEATEKFTCDSRAWFTYVAERLEHEFDSALFEAARQLMPRGTGVIG